MKRKKQITLDMMLKKRRELWEKHHDTELDSDLIRAIADKILDEECLRNEIRESPHLLIELCFTVVNKEKKNVPFFLNRVQRDFIERTVTLGRKKPFFILKGRQQGFTTVITALQLAHAIVRRNFSGFTLADRDDNTKAIFTDKAKVMYNALPERLKPTEKFNSTNELFFDRLNSSWRVASASSNVGRSRTLSFIHYSEVAFFRCSLSDLQKSIAEAATADALCVYETTANGFNESKELWDSGSCHNLFYEWWLTDEYTSNEYEYLENADLWLKNRLEALKKRGLSREQLTWYAKKYSSYIDKTSIRQEYPCSAEEAFITSGDSIFDKEAISNYLSHFDIRSKTGRFEYRIEYEPIKDEGGAVIHYEKRVRDIEFKECQDGLISIVEEPFIHTDKGKIAKKPYVIGADTAGSGCDFFTAKVLDNTTGKCVATLRRRHIDEDLFALQLYCLGKYYNEALIGVEINYSRHPVRVLKEIGYPNLYLSRSVSTQSDSQVGGYGFLTTSSSRPIIISNLVTVMRENLMLETDRETLKEMSTFIRRADGRAAAADGSHDDLVMASAIAHFIGIGYSHNMEITSTGTDILHSFFNNDSAQEDTYMEW